MPIKLNVVIPVFEGPLDLLLHLLEKNDLDIYDIPIANITQQFVDYIKLNQQQNIELTSEFVVMAAELVEIKSRMLLPIHSDDDFEYSGDLEEDPRYDLVQRLIAYKLYKEVSQTFDERFDNCGGTTFKPRDHVKHYQSDDEKKTFADMDIHILVDVLNNIISRIPEQDETRKDYFKKLRRDEHLVEQKLTYLQLKFENQTQWTFSALINDAQTKLEVVVMFLALLELLKTDEYSIQQIENFSDILIERT